ncbi:MAG: transcriptional repressor LexA [Bdellovibrionota bacterium]
MGITPKQKKLVEFIQRFQEKKGFAPSQREIADHFGYQSLGTVQNYLVRLEKHGLLAKKDWNSKRGLRLTPPPFKTTTTATAAASNAIANARRSVAASLSETALLSTVAKSDAQNRVVRLPVLGKVAAGRPIEAIEPHPNDPASGIDVPVSLLRKSGEHFILKVSGNSMIDEGILDGDFVVLRRQKDAANGETVVALVGNEATIKKFYRHRARPTAAAAAEASSFAKTRTTATAGGVVAPVIELRPANAAFAPLFIESLTDAAPDFRIEGVLVGLIRKL